MPVADCAGEGDSLLNRESFDYARWVTKRIGVAEARAEPPGDIRTSGDPAPATILILAAPSPDVPQRVEQARREKVRRIICGFLPDEVDWPTLGLGKAQLLFLQRMEFVPVVLSAESAEVSTAERSLLYLTGGGEAAGYAGIGVLAEAWAEAKGLPLVCADVTTISLNDLGGMLAAAAVIVNDVEEWNLGFAIDLWAARVARPCVRLRQPGYSPVRYGVLGRALPHESPVEVPRLRSLPGFAPTSGLPKDRAAMDEWFSNDTAAARWRSLWSPQTFAAFWAETKFKSAAPMEASHLGARWLDRPVSWAGLAAAQHEHVFPAAAAAHAVATMTDWLAADRRSIRGRQLRKIAIPRWVRTHPGWLDVFRHTSGATPDTKVVVARWATKAIELPDVSSPAMPVVRAGAWAVADGAVSAYTAGLAHAWADRLDVVAAKNAWFPLSPAGRAACTEAFASWLESGRTPRETASEESRILRELVIRDEPWAISFGELASVFRAMAAIRCGRLGIAVRMWRQALQLIGLSAANRIACGFVLRSAWRDASEQALWLRQELMERDPEVRLVRHLLRWHQAQVDALWRLKVGKAARFQLRCAIRMLESEVLGSKRATERVFPLATFYALDGRPEAALDILQALRASGVRLASKPGVAALALWCRRQENEMRRILSEYPVAPTESAWVLFLRAVACQLLGETSEADRVLEWLAQKAPGYLADLKVSDARWSWAAVIFKTAGDGMQSERLRAAKGNVGFELNGLLDDVVTKPWPLAAGWVKLMS